MLEERGEPLELRDPRGSLLFRWGHVSNRVGANIAPCPMHLLLERPCSCSLGMAWAFRQLASLLCCKLEYKVATPSRCDVTRVI